MALDAFEKSREVNGDHGLRNSIEHITLKEALLANTLGSAKVYGRDHELGTLETGKLADVIVVDRNLFEIPHDDILNAKVDITVMDGKVIYDRHDN